LESELLKMLSVIQCDTWNNGLCNMSISANLLSSILYWKHQWRCQIQSTRKWIL